ncbi:MAG: UPF0104 family protein [Candidatus Korarchaeota archaeon NZ13-K]|nr:MAG: UPF0104 family protein [Candidatus Korarchaeota archaeon NZ13-K]
MESQEEIPRIGKKNFLLITVGIALTLPLLMTFDVRSAAERMASMGLTSVALAFASIHLGVLFYNLGWYFLLRRRVPFKDVFLIGWTSLFINLLIPAASTTGEVARVYFVTKRSDITAAEALSSVVAHRVIMIIPFLVSVTLGFSYLVSLGLDGNSLVVAVPITLLALAFYLMYKFSMREDYVRRLIKLLERILRRNLDSLEKSARDYSRSFRHLMSERGLLLITTLCAFLNWLFDMLPIFIYFEALGHKIDPLLGILIYSVSIILILIPIGIPGNMGVREWVMTSLLVLMGLSGGDALALTLASSTITVFLNELIFGLAAYSILVTSQGPGNEGKSF